MANTLDLMLGAGMPAAQANALGLTKSSLTTTGTTAATAALIRSNLVVLTTAGSQTGALLPSTASIGDFVIVTNPTATTGIVYPDSGATLNGGTATTGGQNLAQNKTAMYIKVAALTWVSILTA
jgi:hypothetical protein